MCGEPRPPDARELERLFARCFEASHGTILSGGGSEPLYLPGTPHRVIYREDHFASALHEVAHWCLAGRRRRQLEDYGYWYAPDGRTPEQQAEFERVEAKPQALEWIFADACGSPFELSADNLDAGAGPSEAFARAVRRQRERYRREGLPRRAARFEAALAARFEPTMRTWSRGQHQRAQLQPGQLQPAQLQQAGSRRQLDRAGQQPHSPAVEPRPARPAY